MKRFLPFFLSLFWLLSASSQELSDSISFAEMEDSISGMTIVPIEHPEELLDSIIIQVLLDWLQKPLVCKYQAMHTTDLHTSTPGTTKCIVNAKANIMVQPTRGGKEFHYEGPLELKTLKDTASLYYDLKNRLGAQYILGEMKITSRSYDEPVLQSVKRLMNVHYIKVYSISDESGRGVYRVDFSPKKYPKYGLNVSKYNGSAYFDRNSLRLKQIKADCLSPSSWNIVLGREDKKRWTHTSCVRYKHVFEEVSGTLVVKHIEKAYFLDNYLTGKYEAHILP